MSSRETSDARIPGVPCDWLSETAIVLNSSATPPAASTASAAARGEPPVVEVARHRLRPRRGDADDRPVEAVGVDAHRAEVRARARRARRPSAGRRGRGGAKRRRPWVASLDGGRAAVQSAHRGLCGRCGVGLGQHRDRGRPRDGPPRPASPAQRRGRPPGRRRGRRRRGGAALHARPPAAGRGPRPQHAGRAEPAGDPAVPRGGAGHRGRHAHDAGRARVSRGRR